MAAAKKVGETIQAVMKSVDMSSEEVDTVYQEELLALVEGVTNPTATLVTMVRDMASGAGDLASQERVMDSANGCESAASQLTSSAKVCGYSLLLRHKCDFHI